METFSEHINKEDNNIIRIAAFIADKGTEGVVWKELIIFLHQHNQLTDNEKEELIKSEKYPTGTSAIEEKFRKLIFLLDIGSSFDRDDYKISVTFEGVTSLLDFIELKHARQNSRDAKRYSLLAIGISVFALIFSVVIGLIQLNSSVKIDACQLTKIERIDYSKKIDKINDNFLISNQNLNSLNIKLDSIDKHFKRMKKRR